MTREQENAYDPDMLTNQEHIRSYGEPSPLFRKLDRETPEETEVKRKEKRRERKKEILTRFRDLTEEEREEILEQFFN